MESGRTCGDDGHHVRTLHHYKEVGLLSPSYRSESGHRVYGENDVIRLQQILSLKQLGFPLEGIRECLVDKKLGPLEVVRMHRSHIEKERERVSQLYTRLIQLENALITQQGASVEEFLKTIEVIQMFEKYYTKEPLEELEKRKQDIGPEKMEAYQDQWKVLMDNVRTEMKKGTDPASAQVQKYAVEWNLLLGAFSGGDRAIESAKAQMYENEPKMLEQFGLDPEMWTYVKKMMGYFRTSQTNRP